MTRENEGKGRRGTQVSRKEERRDTQASVTKVKKEETVKPS
jgi:hypothetical protein